MMQMLKRSLGVFSLLWLHTWKAFLSIICLTTGAAIIFTYIYVNQKLSLKNLVSHDFIQMTESLFALSFFIGFALVLLILLLLFHKRQFSIRDGIFLKRLPAARNTYIYMQFIFSLLMLFIYWAVQFGSFLLCRYYFIKQLGEEHLYNIFLILSNSRLLMHLFPLINIIALMNGFLLLINITLLVLIEIYSENTFSKTRILAGFIPLVFYSKVTFAGFFSFSGIGVLILEIAMIIILTRILYYKLY